MVSSAELEAQQLQYLERVQSAIDSGTLRCVFCKTQLNPEPRVIDPNDPKYKHCDLRLVWRWELTSAHPDNLVPDEQGFNFQCDKCSEEQH
jgi:hypothetical protein